MALEHRDFGAALFAGFQMSADFAGCAPWRYASEQILKSLLDQRVHDYTFPQNQQHGIRVLYQLPLGSKKAFGLPACRGSILSAVLSIESSSERLDSGRRATRNPHQPLGGFQQLLARPKQLHFDRILVHSGHR